MSGRRSELPWPAIGAVFVAFLLSAATAQAAAPRIVYVVDDDEISATLASVLPNGKAQRDVTYTDNYDSDPAWDRSHSKVAFVRNGHLFVVGADGKNARRVPNTSEAESPSWGRNGRKLVFSARRNKAVAVFSIRRNGRRLRR